MKFVIRYQYRNITIGGKDFYVTSLFNKLINLLKIEYPEHEFVLESNNHYEKFGYGSISSCMNLSILNPNNGNYILVSLFDNWRQHFIKSLGWNPKKMKQFFYAGGFDYYHYFNFKDANKNNKDSEFPDKINEVYQQFYYNPYFDCCYDEMDSIFKTKSENDSLIFRGWMWDYRKLMTDNLDHNDIIIMDKNKDNQNLSYINYLIDLKKYKAALSLPGGTEICNRDIECFAIGVPVIRPSLQINFEDPLIPNYHYISCYYPCDYSNNGVPKYNSYDDFKKNLLYTWNNVKNNKDYLDFISNNAKSWFDRNCKLQSNLDFLSKKINLNIII
jgi:hypothetical protein